MENEPKREPKSHPAPPPWSTLFAIFFGHRFFTLRACPPTRLHAPNKEAPCFLAPSLPIPSKPDGPRGGPRAPRRGPWAQEVQGAKGTKGPFGPFGPLRGPRAARARRLRRRFAGRASTPHMHVRNFVQSLTLARLPRGPCKQHMDPHGSTAWGLNACLMFKRSGSSLRGLKSGLYVQAAPCTYRENR